MYARLKQAMTSILQTLLEWEWEFRDRGFKPISTGDPSEDERRRRRVTAWLWSLGGACVASIVLASVLQSDICWAIYAVLQIGFFVMVVLAIKLRAPPPTK